MFITIEPQLQPAPPMPEKFETTEDDTLVHNAQVWLTDLRKKYPKRNSLFGRCRLHSENDGLEKE